MSIVDRTHAEQIHRAVGLAKTATIYTHAYTSTFKCAHVSDLHASLLQDQHLEVFLGSSSVISTPNHCAFPLILTASLFVFLLVQWNRESGGLVLRLDVGCGTSTLPWALWNQGQRRQGARYFASLEKTIPSTSAAQLVAKPQLEVWEMWPRPHTQPQIMQLLINPCETETWWTRALRKWHWQAPFKYRKHGFVWSSNE